MADIFEAPYGLSELRGPFRKNKHAFLDPTGWSIFPRPALRENAGNPRSTVTALRFFLPEISPGSHYLAKWQAIEENRIPGYNHAVGEASHNPRKSPQAHHVLASFEFRQYETSDADYFLDLPSPGKRAFSLLLPQRVFSIRTGAPRSFR